MTLNGYGWGVQGHAEWSPDGTKLAMFAGGAGNPQIYVTNADGSGARQVTARGGVNVDPSFSPDGQTIVFIGCPSKGNCRLPNNEVFTVATSCNRCTTATQRTNNRFQDNDPYYAPDGTTIAWIQKTDSTPAFGVQWSLFRMNANGTNQQNLTNDANVNATGAWSCDGGFFYFHRLEWSQPQPQTFGVYRIAYNPQVPNPVFEPVVVSAPGSGIQNEYPSFGAPRCLG
jgi:TolB protein